MQHANPDPRKRRITLTASKPTDGEAIPTHCPPHLMSVTKGSHPGFTVPCNTVPMALSTGLIPLLENVDRAQRNVCSCCLIYCKRRHKCTEDQSGGRSAQSKACGKGRQNISRHFTLKSLHCSSLERSPNTIPSGFYESIIS